MIDKLSEHPNQIDKSPYSYVWDDPISKNDPDGNCPFCLIALEAVVEYFTAETVTATVIATGATATAALAMHHMNSSGQIVANRDNTSVAPIYHPSPILNSASNASDKSKAGDTPSNPQPTSRAARRDAMRKGGVPTSQPLHQDKLANTPDQVLLDRDGENTVQDGKNDRSHPGQPHWEAGKTKKDESQPDGLNRTGNDNRPRMGNDGKGKSYYPPKP